MAKATRSGATPKAGEPPAVLLPSGNRSRLAMLIVSGSTSLKTIKRAVVDASDAMKPK